MTAHTITHFNSPTGEFFDFLHRIHGHRCPMSIMGARLGFGALPVVGRHGRDGDVRALYMHQTCAADGIMAVLGTTPGNNNLRTDATSGLHMLDAENVTKGRRVRVTLTENALSLGKRYGELRRAGTGEAEMAGILNTLETLPDADVVEVSELPPRGN